MIISDEYNTIKFACISESVSRALVSQKINMHDV